MNKRGIEVTISKLKILELIFNNPGISISDLSKKVNLHFSTVYRIVTKLEKKYSIVKTMYDHKRRCYRVYPTYITCNSSIFIFPSISIVNDEVVFLGLYILQCPYYHECPYRGKCAFQEDKCMFWKSLPDDKKSEIRMFFEYLKNVIKNISTNQ